ncbi:hypothetical protein [Bdellovibrio sp. HCB2-146]|uniref:hypothetical protein n=1 Tax=Bdellovibrio sp. HCB2-146 TaxID=3394362 RepID=UPI0039BCD2A4
MKFAAALFITLIGMQAHAGFLFEPMVAYEMGSNNVEFTSDGQGIVGVDKIKSDNSAINYGARLGFLFAPSGFWFAGNYNVASSGKAKFDTHEDTFERTTIGLDIGFWRGRWNFFVGYNFSDKLDFMQVNGTDKDHVTGTSIRAGIGFLLYHHIAFNLEGVMHTYTAGSDESGSTIFQSDFEKYVKSFNQISYSAGLSFPF